MLPKGLGRRVPTDWEHVQKYALIPKAIPRKPTPVVLGINWYRDFSSPVQVGPRYFIGRSKNWGPVDGGHAICVKPIDVEDPLSWWDFYNQGNNPSCVGFSCSRMMSLLNRDRYSGTWLYKEAQKVDEWEGEDYDGSSVRGGFRVLAAQGHRKVYSGKTQSPDIKHGIEEVYRWAKTVDQVVDVLCDGVDRDFFDRMEAVPLLQSWGRSYPHIVYLGYKGLERLLKEDGEAGLACDK